MNQEAFLFLYYKAHPALSRYIKNYLVVKSPSGVRHDQLLLPDTEYMMAINLGDPVTITRVDGTVFIHQSFSCLLLSHYDKCFRVESANLFYVVVHFYPEGLFHFLKQSLSSIPSNSFLLIPSIAELSLLQIADECSSSDHGSKAIELIERSLVKYFSNVSKNDNVLSAALQLLNQYHCHLSIETLCRHTYSSYRQLDRKFSERVGFSPKQYAQIVRFRKAYDHLMNLEGNMITVVAEHNYYDQMHLIKDFKKFTTYTPKQLLELNKNEGKSFHALYEDLCSHHSLS